MTLATGSLVQANRNSNPNPNPDPNPDSLSMNAVAIERAVYREQSPGA